MGEKTTDKNDDVALANAIEGAGSFVEDLTVTLSNELVHLLSEQLYTSPLKAIEELVVNSYDADADECRVGLLLDQSLAEHTGTTVIHGDEETQTEPGEELADEDAIAPTGVIAIYDDGSGMDVQGLRDLWKIGISPKSEAPKTGKKGRLIIGKFGIGKLATYAIANRITYVTARAGQVHHVVCDFRRFKQGAAAAPVTLKIQRLDQLPELLKRPDFGRVLSKLGLKPEQLAGAIKRGWTLCLLDNLKPKARQLKVGRLGWVLRTAMPLKSDFSVFLNGELQASAKENIPLAVSFSVADFDDSRVAKFNQKHDTKLRKENGALVEPKIFPTGFRGRVIVAEKSLVGKADTLLGRSNGFFVRVRGRLVNNEDKLFHNTPLSFETFNRFRADLDIDDLHDDVTAPREGVEAGRRRVIAAAVARELFNQARDRYEEWQKKKQDQKLTPDHDRVYVAPRLVERPVADALAMYGTAGSGVEADKGWFYMQPMADDELTGVIKKLYEDRSAYRFSYIGLGESERMTKFQPSQALFTVNADHELVRAFADEPRSKELLDLIATGEVMLEVYMKEAGIDGFVIGEVLERRDLLLRSLAQDRVYSLESIALALRNNVDSAHDLEMALVAAARAIGFNAKHIGGSSEPDGIARFLDSTMKETTITLEAKSSAGVPTLGQLDLAGVKRHRDHHSAIGCLVIAPTYPGIAEPKSAVSVTADADRLSCWTVEQLARVVEACERRQITATQIADIVVNKYKPMDVATAVDALLLEHPNMQALYRAIIDILRRMFKRRSQVGDQRKVSQIAAVLTDNEAYKEFHDITEKEVRRAIVDMAHVSRGTMSIVGDDVIAFYTDIEELARRVAALTGELGPPRSVGTFTSKDRD